MAGRRWTTRQRANRVRCPHDHPLNIAHYSPARWSMPQGHGGSRRVGLLCAEAMAMSEESKPAANTEARWFARYIAWIRLLRWLEQTTRQTSGQKAANG